MSSSQDLILVQLLDDQAPAQPLRLESDGTLTIRIVSDEASPQVIADDVTVSAVNDEGEADYRVSSTEATAFAALAANGATEVLVSFRFVRASDGAVFLRPRDGAMRHRIYSRP